MGDVTGVISSNILRIVLFEPIGQGLTRRLEALEHLGKLEIFEGEMFGFTELVPNGSRHQQAMFDPNCSDLLEVLFPFGLIVRRY